jgi:hypothetical protein
MINHQIRAYQVRWKTLPQRLGQLVASSLQPLVSNTSFLPRVSLFPSTSETSRNDASFTFVSTTVFLSWFWVS